MEVFESFVAVARETEGFVVSPSVKFPVTRQTAKAAYPEVQTHGYEVDLVAARADRLVLATVKSFFGSQGVKADHVTGKTTNVRWRKAYALLNDVEIRDGVLAGASECYGYHLSDSNFGCTWAGSRLQGRAPTRRRSARGALARLSEPVRLESLARLTSSRRSPRRPLKSSTVASATQFVKENVNVARRFIGDRITQRSSISPDELAAGEGQVTSVGAKQIAVARDQDATLHAVSARCTHMGCIVHWNRAETTWDCPCHGSRFSIDGTVIEGPAVDHLEPQQLPTEES